MSTVAFDTHAFIKKLVAAGMPENQAEILAGELAEVPAGSGLATRTDLRDLEIRLVKWMVGIAAAQFAVLIGILVKLL